MPEKSHSRWRAYRGAALVAALAFSLTCGSVKRFEIFHSGEVFIDAETGQILTSINFDGFLGINLEEKEEFRDEGYSNGQIGSVEIRELTMAVAAPEGANLDFLVRIAFQVEADGLEPLEIVRVDSVPRGEKELVFELIATDLTDYARKGSMSIVANVIGAAPEDATTLFATYTLDVEVDLGGAAGCSTSTRAR